MEIKYVATSGSCEHCGPDCEDIYQVEGTDYCFICCENMGWDEEIERRGDD